MTDPYYRLQLQKLLPDEYRKVERDMAFEIMRRTRDWPEELVELINKIVWQSVKKGA